MSCCISIQIQNIGGNTPQSLLIDGGLFLDISGTVSATEQVFDLNSATGGLRRSGVQNITLEDTPRNRYIIDNLLIENQIKVIVLARGIPMQEDILTLKSYQDCKYTVQLEKGSDWIEAASKVKLSEVEGYDNYAVTRPTMVASWINEYAYPSDPAAYVGIAGYSQKGFWFPVCYYGGLSHYNTGQGCYNLKAEDLRPWFHPYKLLKNALCAAGINFNSRVLQTFRYGREACLLMGDGYMRYQDRPDALFKTHDSNLPNGNKLTVNGGKNYRVKSVMTTAKAIPQWNGTLAGLYTILDFSDDSVNGYDTGQALNGGFWHSYFASPLKSFVRGRGKWKVKYHFIITGNASLVAFNFEDLDTAFNPTGSSPVGIPMQNGYNAIFHTGGVKSYTIETTWEYYESTYFEQIQVTAFSQNSAVTIGIGSYIEMEAEWLQVYGKVTDPLYTAILNPTSYINPDMTALDLLQGMMHLVNGKASFASGTNSLNILPTKSGFWITEDEESYEGFSKSGNDIDLRPLQICCGDSFGIDVTKANANYLLAFQPENDEWSKTQGKNIYSKTYDTGKASGKKTGTTENRNPLFEPMVERDFVELVGVNDGTPISVPAIWDNSDHEMTVNTGYRIGFGYRYVAQMLGDTPAALYRNYRDFDGDLAVDFGYITQLSKVDFLFGNLGGAGQFAPNDLIRYNESLGRFYDEGLTSPSTFTVRQIEILCPTVSFFKRLCFRDSYIINSGGKARRTRLIKKGAFDLCEGKTVTLEFIDEFDCTQK